MDVLYNDVSIHMPSVYFFEDIVTKPDYLDPNDGSIQVSLSYDPFKSHCILY